MPPNTEENSTEEEYKGPFVDVSDEPVILEPDESFNTVLPQLEIPPFEQPVIESYQQQQQQPIRRRRKPKMNETTKKK